MKSVIALTAIALASAATVVVAAPADGQARRGAMLERLKAADTNGDGSSAKRKPRPCRVSRRISTRSTRTTTAR